jgi:hypothetical protein
MGYRSAPPSFDHAERDLYDATPPSRYEEYGWQAREWGENRREDQDNRYGGSWAAAAGMCSNTGITHTGANCDGGADGDDDE